MTDDPWTPISVPPLGPPYTETVAHLPPPRFPKGPPEQWPTAPALLPTPPPPPPIRIRWIDDPRNQAVAWGAIAIVFAIIIGAVVGASAAGGPDLAAAPIPTTTPDTATDSSSESDTTTTTEAPSLSSVILDIETFVERERGLKFKQPVPVSLAGEGEFQRLLLSHFDSQSASLLEEQAVLRALGLIPTDLDLIREERTLASISVVGFYDPDTKQLVVRSAGITPFVRQVMAHELTHALDDQWFDLNRPQLDTADDESRFAFSGLVEGNARRVEDAYVATMSAADQIQSAREQAALLLQHPEILDLPSVLLQLQQAPYDEGALFVKALLDDGGQTRLDNSFATPPVTSEQILDSARYIAGEGPVAVPPPAADGTPDNVGVLGELLLREMLFDSLPSVTQVDRAIAGWGGDSYVTWVDATGKTCLRDTFVADTQGDMNELVQAITEWGVDHSAVVDAPAEGFATFTVCA